MIIATLFSYLIQIHFISVSDLIDRSDPFTQLKSNSIEDQNGYKFSFDRILKNGDKTWRCAKRRSKCKCQAYVKTRENLIILQYYKHNHHPYGTNSLKFPKTRQRGGGGIHPVDATAVAYLYKNPAVQIELTHARNLVQKW